MKLREKLKGIVPEDCLHRLTNRFHVVGDIAILALPQEVGEYKEKIAQGVLSQDRSIRLVLNKTSKLEGEKRVAEFEVIAGSGSTVTEHLEYGFVYCLDVMQVFYSSRLGYERARVAAQVNRGELVLVPFAGVGPFVVPAASRGARIVALEKSSEACRWLALNAGRNRVSENVAIINADALAIPAMLKQNFDRAIIPAPYGMDRILETISQRVKTGGKVHFYTFKKRHQIAELSGSYKDMGLEVEQFRRCGNVAPGVSRWAFDMIKL